MAEIRVQVPNDYIDPLRQRLKLSTNSAVLQDALTLLKWAADERAKGKIILSMGEDSSDAVRLLLPSLENAAPSALHQT